MSAEAVEHTQPRQAAANEAQLIRAAQAGDGSAFAGLVEAYWGRLYRWLYQLTHDRHQAEDLAQEAFLKAFAHLNRFRADTNFRAWLFRIAHNGFANGRRAAQRRGGPLPDDLPDREAGPVDQALSREALAGLADAVKRLPADFRGALLLRVEEGLSFRQIAEVLQTTEETARWRVFKARQKLLAQLEPERERDQP
jgi:RNA polymerase sigma-70 factor (ECF subfamily)